MRKRVKDDLLTYPQAGHESAASGFVPTWNVADRYVVSDGVLREAGGLLRSYNPFTDHELPTQLARISTGELSPEEFASGFGLLGYDRLFRPTQVARVMAGDVPAKELSKQRGGDPLEWILAHSRTVALCLELIGALEEADDVAITEVVEEATVGPYAWSIKVANLPTKFTARTLTIHRHGHAAIARSWLSNFVTSNITGIVRRLERDAYGARLASYFSFRAMIETVYWQLADKIESGGVRRCLECKRFFLARDKRQQYCPPFPGANRSRCSSRLNTGNFRLRKDG